jgi:hypothetical protein
MVRITPTTGRFLTTKKSNNSFLLRGDLALTDKRFVLGAIRQMAFPIRQNPHPSIVARLLPLEAVEEMTPIDSSSYCASMAWNAPAAAVGGRPTSRSSVSARCSDTPRNGSTANRPSAS